MATGVGPGPSSRKNQCPCTLGQGSKHEGYTTGSTSEAGDQFSDIYPQYVALGMHKGDYAPTRRRWTRSCGAAESPYGPPPPRPRSVDNQSSVPTLKTVRIWITLGYPPGNPFVRPLGPGLAPRDAIHPEDNEEGDTNQGPSSRNERGNNSNTNNESNSPNRDSGQSLPLILGLLLHGRAAMEAMIQGWWRTYLETPQASVSRRALARY